MFPNVFLVAEVAEIVGISSEDKISISVLILRMGISKFKY